MFIYLIALTFLSVVILAIEFVWASTNGREIIVRRERGTVIMFVPTATSCSLVHD